MIRSRPAEPGDPQKAFPWDDSVAGGDGISY
jgi:hypothetical protein